MNTEQDKKKKQGTGMFRLKPDFILIGAQRCGTTTLYNTLSQHPQIAPASKKEVHFFDYNYSRGMKWYLGHFPTWLEKLKRPGLITGEASPYYLFHPRAPGRVKSHLPDCRFLVILRNPVDRAFSQYHHARKQNLEPLSFEDAIAMENERLKGELEKMEADENYISFSHQKHSYLSRGIYVDQLEQWMKIFDRKQFLILQSEEFFRNPQKVLDQVTQFLGVSTFAPPSWRKDNDGGYSKMDPELRKKLSAYFAPHNKRLFEFLGVEWEW